MDAVCSIGVYYTVYLSCALRSRFPFLRSLVVVWTRSVVKILSPILEVITFWSVGQRYPFLTHRIYILHVFPLSIFPQTPYGESMYSSANWELFSVAPLFISLFNNLGNRSGWYVSREVSPRNVH